MGSADLAVRRAQMGRSLQPMVQANGLRAVGEVGTGYWMALFGVPSPDANLALVDSDDTAIVAETKGKVEATGYPTVFMLAGPASTALLDGGWQAGGSMPFMNSPLAEGHLGTDARVRQATGDDFDVVCDLLAEAYGMTREVADSVGMVLRARTRDEVKIWLLVEGRHAVSTVTTSIVDDAACVWCMGTPARFARRGYGRALLGDVLRRAKDGG